jgi:hypothetical protein
MADANGKGTLFSDLDKWLIVSASGGDRLFLGRPNDRDREIVTLSPYYSLGIQAGQVQPGKLQIQIIVEPAYYFVGDGRMTLKWTNLIEVGSLLNGEIENLRKAIAGAESTKQALRAAMSGIVPVEIAEMNRLAAALSPKRG